MEAGEGGGGDGAVCGGEVWEEGEGGGVVLIEGGVVLVGGGRGSFPGYAMSDEEFPEGSFSFLSDD